MTYMAVAYGLSIGVIIVVLFVALLHPKVPTGVIGTLILGGMLAGELASIERFGETPNWRVLITVSEAMLAVYIAAKWLRSRP